MQKLHLVGFTTDHEGLILSARRGARSGSYLLTIDGALEEAVDERRARREEESEAEDTASASKRSRVESALPVREIQARLRQGRTIAEVARAAGVDTDWVERFAPPVLAERAKVIEQVRSVPLRRARLGPSEAPIGEAVRRNLAERGVSQTPDEFAAAWTARQVADGRWAVRYAFHHRGHDQTLRFDLDEATGEVSTSDRASGQLGYIAPRTPPTASSTERSRTPKAADPEPRPVAKRAVVSTGYRPDPDTKAVSRSAKERERAAVAMRKAAAKRAIEGERAAARKLRERREAAARREREERAAEARAEREAAAARRAAEAAAKARKAAAKHAAAERAAAKAKAAKTTTSKASKAAPAKRTTSKASKAAPAKRAPTKATSKATKATKATKTTRSNPPKRTATKATAARKTTAAAARTQSARARTAPATARSRPATSAAMASAPPTPTRPPEPRPTPAADRDDRPTRLPEKRVAAAARPSSPPVKAVAPRAPRPAPVERPSAPSPRPTGWDSGALPPLDDGPAVRILRDRPVPEGARVSGAAESVYGSESARAMFRRGLVEQASGDVPTTPAVRRPRPAPLPNGADRPRRTRPLRAT